MRTNRFLPVLSAGVLALVTFSPVRATPFTIPPNSTTAQTLTGGEAGLINFGGVLTVAGLNTVAVTLTNTTSGTINLSNAGTISQTGSARTIRDNVGGLTVTILNNSGGQLLANDADVIQFNKANSSVTLDNYGFISSNNASAGGAQAIDWNAITNGQNILQNHSTGQILAKSADAVRPGVNGIIVNNGLIHSIEPSAGSSADGIDAQTNSGIQITNYDPNLDAAIPNAPVIVGARHGITGGATSAGSGTYAMSITNNSPGIIIGNDGSGINIDGFNEKEVVTVSNSGLITGTSATRDSDGIDVDGVLNLTNSGTIRSLNAGAGETSEGLSIGGGSINNLASGVIQGSSSNGLSRGITLTGVDTDPVTKNPIVPRLGIYADSTISNAGQIIGDTDAGIAVTGAGGGYTVVINNDEGGLIQGTSATTAAIQFDDPSNTYLVNNAGTIQQAGTGKAIQFNGIVANTLNVTGGAAQILGDISGHTDADSTANFSPGPGQTFSYAGKISNFKVNIDGGGTVVLSGNSDYTGGTTVTHGSTVQINNDANLGATASALTLDRGTLIAYGPSRVEISHPIVLGPGGGTIKAEGSSFRLDGSISGSGPLDLFGAFGAITFSNGTDNTYTGLTTARTGSYVTLDSPSFAISGDLTIEAGAAVVEFGSGEIAATSTLTVNGAFELASVPMATSTQTVAVLQGNGAIFTTPENANLGILTVGAGNFSGTIRDNNGSPDSNGTLALVKQGPGTLTLSGHNTFTGGTTLTGGTLLVANSNALGRGDFIGQGGNLQTGGGNHLIQVGGDFVQQAGSTLTLQINASTGGANPSDAAPGGPNNDFLDVAGTATLGGTLDLVFNQNLVPNQGEIYPLITAGGGITGVSDSYLNPVTTLQALKLKAVGELSQDGHDFFVTITPIQQNLSGLFAGSLSPNQRQTAGALDTYIASVPVGGSFSPLIVALDQASADAPTFGGALNQLTPLAFGRFSSSTAFNNASFSTQGFDDYLGNQRGADGTLVSRAGEIDSSGLTVNDPDVARGLQQVHSRLLAWQPTPARGLLSDSALPLLGGIDAKAMTGCACADTPAAAQQWNAFISGAAILAQDFSDPGAGLAHSDTTTGTTQLGLDYRLSRNFLVGVTFGYGHTDADLDALGSTATVDTYAPGVYASFAQDGWYANALGSYGFSEYEQERRVQLGAFGGTATSAPSGRQVVGNLDGGYDFRRGPWTLGPTLGVQFVHLEVDRYTETGLPGANLSVNENQADSLRSRLGGHVSYAVTAGELVLTPHLSASWQHEFLDQARGLTSQFSDLASGSFLVETGDPSRDSALLDLGLDARIDSTWTVFADYLAQAGQENYFGQSVQAGVKVGF